MQTLMNSIVVPVVDRNGRKIDERQFVNTPWAELFPDEKFIVIDWTSDSAIEVEDLTQPVEYDGDTVLRLLTLGDQPSSVGRRLV